MLVQKEIKAVYLGETKVRPSVKPITTAGIYWNSDLGLISLSSDGSTWLTIADKNLGATTTDTSSSNSYGDYYCWGGKTPFVSTTNANEENWEQVQTPPPSGFHIPTKTEVENLISLMKTLLGVSNVTGNMAVQYLLLPYSGYKNTNGTIAGTGTQSRYWTSTNSDTSNAYYYQHSSTGNLTMGANPLTKSLGRSLRCFYDSSIQPTEDWTVLRYPLMSYNDLLNLRASGTDNDVITELNKYPAPYYDDLQPYMVNGELTLEGRMTTPAKYNSVNNIWYLYPTLLSYEEICAMIHTDINSLPPTTTAQDELNSQAVDYFNKFNSEGKMSVWGGGGYYFSFESVMMMYYEGVWTENF